MYVSYRHALIIVVEEDDNIIVVTGWHRPNDIRDYVEKRIERGIWYEEHGREP